MLSQNHSSYQFGVLYPSNDHGVGSPDDLLAFLEAIGPITQTSRLDFLTVLKLGEEPVWGREMLQLFNEARELERAFSLIKTSQKVLSDLKLVNRNTKLRLDGADLSQVFARIFQALTNDAPELVELRMRKPENTILTTGSVRFGPVEPVAQAALFYKLPQTAFEMSDGPLWLSDAIFDLDFYQKLS